MKKLKLFFVLAALITVVIACNQRALSQNDNTGLYDTEAFKNYWYAGKAEVNAYNLDQSRYGENRDGKAMLIFVTEGFSKSKQVKLDDPEAAGNDKVTVMKLNYTKNFVTGIYPYSMMLSAFTATDRTEVSLKTRFTRTHAGSDAPPHNPFPIILTRISISILKILTSVVSVMLPPTTGWRSAGPENTSLPPHGPATA